MVGERAATRTDTLAGVSATVRITRLVAASLVALLAASRAWCEDASAASADPWQDLISPDRPGAANPPTVVGRGVFQLETAFESLTAHPPAAASATTLDLPTLLRLGLGHALELRLESETLSRTRTNSGFADVSVEAKWCPIGGSGDAPLALAFLPSVTLPSGSGGFSAGKTQASVAALGGWTLASGVSFNLGLGASRVVDETGDGYQTQLDSQVAVGVPLVRDWAVSADGFVTDPLASGAIPAWGADAGVEFYPSPDLQLDLSVSHTFTDPFASTSFQIGVSWRRPAHPPH